MLKWIKNLFKRKKESYYPDDFAIIKFTESAFESGVRENSNKIIERHFYDWLGNQRKKIYRYSPERVYSLQEVLKIPIYDKTEEELKFPVIGRIELDKIKFVSN